jgi:tetratricopeptide (TPR) repeat protein
MTPKQVDRIKSKIKNIKAALAADKRYWGGFHHDGMGLRYRPLQFYIQIEDYSGALRYLNWFNKNFPDDAGFPVFLFEWMIILFKTGRLDEAKKKAVETFNRNNYLFDKFFGRQITPIEKWEGSNLEIADYAIKHFDYSYETENLSDFSLWLTLTIKSENLFI